MAKNTIEKQIAHAVKHLGRVNRKGSSFPAQNPDIDTVLADSQTQELIGAYVDKFNQFLSENTLPNGVPYSLGNICTYCSAIPIRVRDGILVDYDPYTLSSKKYGCEIANLMIQFEFFQKLLELQNELTPNSSVDGKVRQTRTKYKIKADECGLLFDTVFFGMERGKMCRYIAKGAQDEMGCGPIIMVVDKPVQNNKIKRVIQRWGTPVMTAEHVFLNLPNERYEHI